jgi:hypothetical protein
MSVTLAPQSLTYESVAKVNTFPLTERGRELKCRKVLVTHEDPLTDTVSSGIDLKRSVAKLGPLQVNFLYHVLTPGRTITAP